MLIIFESVGRPCTTSHESYLKKLSQYENEIIIDGELANSGHEVYKKIAGELEVNYRNVHLVAKRYFDKEKKDIKNNSNEKIELSDSEESQNDSEPEYTLFDSKFKVSSEDQKYCIDIKNIGLFSYSDNEIKLQSEWSDILNDIIWNFSKCPCIWTFTKQKNVANEKVVHGSCRSTQCNASLFAYTENNQTKMKIVIKNFNPEAEHIKKRILKGTNKKKSLHYSN